MKRLLTYLKQDFFTSLEGSLRPKSMRFYKDRRRRDSDNNYPQFPSYASNPIIKEKNDYRVGYQDSRHNIRYINHSTAEKEKETLYVANTKLSDYDLKDVISRLEVEGEVQDDFVKILKQNKGVIESYTNDEDAKRLDVNNSMSVEEKKRISRETIKNFFEQESKINKEHKKTDNLESLVFLDKNDLKCILISFRFSEHFQIY